MNKKVTNEKEIHKARLERRWDDVIDFAAALNHKTAAGNLSTEERELYGCFLYGEASFEKCLDQCDSSAYPCSTLSKDELNRPFNLLNAAITAVKKVKESFPYVYQDAHWLISKYHYVNGDYELCIKSMEALDMVESENLPKRSKYMRADILTCKGLCLEALGGIASVDDIIDTYDEARGLIISLCNEDEKNLAVKRATSAGGNPILITRLLSNCFVRPAYILVNGGRIDEAIKTLRQIMKGAECSALTRIRMTVCRCLAEIILTCASPVEYVGPVEVRALPASESTLSLSKQSKRSASMSESFCPKDEVEESVLLLLLSEATLSKNTVSQRREDVESKQQLLNESSLVNDLLALVFSRRDQYNHITKSMERVMKIAFEIFHLWFQYGLATMCCGKYRKALMVFQQCHALQPENAEVLLLCAKLCINYLQEYDTAITYSRKVTEVTDDPIVKASGHLAAGISLTHLACNGNTSGVNENYLQDALSSLNAASSICSNDAEIQFHLAFCQALTKQLVTATGTIKSSLSSNPDHLPSLHLLTLLLTAQKKYGEALEVLEAAIEEYPEDFNLLVMKIKISEECYGSRVALVTCHYALLLWNDLYNKNDPSDESEKAIDGAKSPAISATNKGNESKFFDGTQSIKSKRSFHDSGGHLDTPVMKKIDSTSLLDEDCNGSLAASIRIERTLSVASESVNGIPGGTFTAAVAYLCKLWLVTAECFINIGDLTEAFGCILEASSIFPVSPEVLFMRGRYNEAKGNIPEAKACYDSVLSVLPTHRTAAQRLGLLHFDDGKHVLAEKLLRGCILHDPVNHTAWNDLGLVLESAGRYDEAADCFMTSLLLESTTPIVPYTTITRLFNATDSC